MLGAVMLGARMFSGLPRLTPKFFLQDTSNHVQYAPVASVISARKFAHSHVVARDWTLLDVEPIDYGRPFRYNLLKVVSGNKKTSGAYGSWLSAYHANGCWHFFIQACHAEVFAYAAKGFSLLFQDRRLFLKQCYEMVIGLPPSKFGNSSHDVSIWGRLAAAMGCSEEYLLDISATVA